jgi:putative restriction endonuclease
VAFGRFDPGLWELLREGHSRHQFRAALIARYFPEKRDRLAAIAAERAPLPKADEMHGELPPGRDAAFRRIILEVYDYRCAACGIRVLLDQQLSLVQAAHLVPFGISRNDKPNNGLALCPNHHWAMDQHVIAPCPDSRHRAGNPAARLTMGRLAGRVATNRREAFCNLPTTGEREFRGAQ